VQTQNVTGLFQRGEVWHRLSGSTLAGGESAEGFIDERDVEGGGCSFGAKRLLYWIKLGGRGGDHPTGTPPAQLGGASPAKG